MTPLLMINMAVDETIAIFSGGNRNFHIFNPKTHISKNHESKTHPIVNWRILESSRQKIRMDEFSSKTACVTTWKMKILEKFLDEFSMICQ